MKAEPAGFCLLDSVPTASEAPLQWGLSRNSVLDPGHFEGGIPRKNIHKNVSTTCILCPETP